MTSSENQEKVFLIDCDPGVDDCLALMMILAQPSCAIKTVGITCAAGNVGVQQVTLNAARILKLLGITSKIPIFRGCQEPLLSLAQPSDAGYYHGKDGLGDVPDVDPPCSDDLIENVAEGHAVDAILRLSREYTGKLQIVCLGALTNVAIAAKLDPDLPKRLKSLHVLGGTMRGHGNQTPCAEYNFLTDPEAAHIVLYSFPQFCAVQLLPYEAAVDCSVPVPWFDNLLSRPTKTADFFRQIFRVCQNFELKSIASGISTGYVLCDSYMACVVLNPMAVKKSIRACVGVELGGTISRGSLVIDHENRELSTFSSKPIEIVEEVDHELYRELLQQAFSI